MTLVSILTRAKCNEISEYPHLIRRAYIYGLLLIHLIPQYWPLLFEVSACSLK